MTRSSDHTRFQTGLSLIEVLLVTVLMTAIVGSIASVYLGTTEAGAMTNAKTLRFAEGARVMAELQQAVRSADEVRKAEAGRLEVEARYLTDLDDDVEIISFYDFKGVLYRVVIQPTLEVETTVLLEGVQSFSAFSFELSDKLVAADYHPDWFWMPPGKNLAWSIGKLKNKLLDLGQIDSEFTSSYDEINEQIELIPDLELPKTLTITPNLARDGVNASVDFTPRDGLAEYRPLVYGDEEPDTNNISIVFGSDGFMRIRRAEGGSVVEEKVSNIVWEENQAYSLLLNFTKTKAFAYMKRKGATIGYRKIGGIQAGSIDGGQIHLQALTDQKRGVWDNLHVNYPFVDLHLTLDVGGGHFEVLHGGAGRRSTP